MICMLGREVRVHDVIITSIGCKCGTLQVGIVEKIYQDKYGLKCKIQFDWYKRYLVQGYNDRLVNAIKVEQTDNLSDAQKSALKSILIMRKHLLCNLILDK